MPIIRRNTFSALSCTLALGLVAVMGQVAGCKKNDPTPGVVTTEAPATNTKDTSGSCATDGRVQPFAANMKVQGNSHNLTFVIVKGEPMPPISGKNTWTVQLLTAAGAPATGYTLAVTPYMPDHAHGPTTAPTVAPEGQNYVISNIDFFMGGVWRTTLTAKDAQGNIVDAANVFLCVPG